MKDYYRILGVKETATAEEIHDRWIELMHTYHPDRTIGGEFDEEMAKEINEAYEVLKHSSSRLEYDLESKRQRRSNRFLMRKSIWVIMGLTLLLIFLPFLFRKTEAPVRGSRKVPPSPSKVTHPSGEPRRKAIVPEEASRAERDETPEKAEKTSSTANLFEDEGEPPASSKRHEASHRPSRPQDSMNSAGPPASVQADRSKEVKPFKPLEPKRTLPLTASVTDGSRALRDEDSKRMVKIFPLMAGEEEVKGFLDRYVDHYNRRDIQGFLSLFSLKAVQNQKDGWEEIRRIYENFFYQSEQLCYELEDLKVEICDRAVNVRARYTVDQILRKDGERRVWKVLR